MRPIEIEMTNGVKIKAPAEEWVAALVLSLAPRNLERVTNILDKYRPAFDTVLKNATAEQWLAGMLASIPPQQVERVAMNLQTAMRTPIVGKARFDDGGQIIDDGKGNVTVMAPPAELVAGRPKSNG